MNPLRSPRLIAIASLVPRRARLADIGTDHGHLVALCLRQGRIAYGIATDRARAPLQRAQRTLAGWPSHSIDFRLGTGLQTLHPGEVDAIVIAGIGGRQICRILDERFELLDTVTTVIVQPQAQITEVRQWLSDRYLQLDCEHMLMDRDQIHWLGRFTPKSVSAAAWTAAQIRFGPHLMCNPSPPYLTWLARQSRRLGAALASTGGRRDKDTYRTLCDDYEAFRREQARVEGLWQHR